MIRDSHLHQRGRKGGVLTRWRILRAERQLTAAVEDMPDYLLRDIGYLRDAPARPRAEKMGPWL